MEALDEDIVKDEEDGRDVVRPLLPSKQFLTDIDEVADFGVGQAESP